MNDEQFLMLAIQKAREAIMAGQVPVGAAVVRGGWVVGAAHNTVWRDCDPTAHAEINVLRQTAFTMRTIFLHGCTVYATLEPCSMCMSALMWTKVDRVVYGASIADATKIGFPEIWVPAKELVARAGLPVKVEQYGPLRDTCLGLFQEWHAAGAPRVGWLPKQ
jgi:guanine deaminase